MPMDWSFRFSLSTSRENTFQILSGLQVKTPVRPGKGIRANHWHPKGIRNSGAMDLSVVSISFVPSQEMCLV